MMFILNKKYRLQFIKKQLQMNASIILAILLMRSLPVRVEEEEKVICDYSNPKCQHGCKFVRNDDDCSRHVGRPKNRIACFAK